MRLQARHARSRCCQRTRVHRVLSRMAALGAVGARNRKPPPRCAQRSPWPSPAWRLDASSHPGVASCFALSGGPHASSLRSGCGLSFTVRLVPHRRLDRASMPPAPRPCGNPLWWAPSGQPSAGWVDRCPAAAAVGKGSAAIAASAASRPSPAGHHEPQAIGLTLDSEG